MSAESAEQQKGRLSLLTSIGKEIAAHERSLVELRQIEKKLVRQYERSKCADEIDYLRTQLAVKGWDVEFEFNKAG